MFVVFDAWAELGVEPTADVGAIKRAYASRLKTTRPDEDAAAFQRLRQAYEWATSQARDRRDDRGGPISDPPAAREPVAPAAQAAPAAPAAAQGADAIVIEVQLPPLTAQPETAFVQPRLETPDALADHVMLVLQAGGGAALVEDWPRLSRRMDEVPLVRREALSVRLATLVLSRPGFPADWLHLLAAYFGWGSDYRVDEALGAHKAQQVRALLDRAQSSLVHDQQILARWRGAPPWGSLYATDQAFGDTAARRLRGLYERANKAPEPVAEAQAPTAEDAGRQQVRQLVALLGSGFAFRGLPLKALLFAMLSSGWLGVHARSAGAAFVTRTLGLPLGAVGSLDRVLSCAFVACALLYALGIGALPHDGGPLTDAAWVVRVVLLGGVGAIGFGAVALIAHIGSNCSEMLREFNWARRASNAKRWFLSADACAAAAFAGAAAVALVGAATHGNEWWRHAPGLLPPWAAAMFVGLCLVWPKDKAWLNLMPVLCIAMAVLLEPVMAAHGGFLAAAAMGMLWLSVCQLLMRAWKEADLWVTAVLVCTFGGIFSMWPFALLAPLLFMVAASSFSHMLPLAAIGLSLCMSFLQPAAAAAPAWQPALQALGVLAVLASLQGLASAIVRAPWFTLPASSKDAA
jgi:hypothetical protein